MRWHTLCWAPAAPCSSSPAPFRGSCPLPSRPPNKTSTALRFALLRQRWCSSVVRAFCSGVAAFDRPGQVLVPEGSGGSPPLCPLFCAPLCAFSPALSVRSAVRPFTSLCCGETLVASVFGLCARFCPPVGLSAPRLAPSPVTSYCACCAPYSGLCFGVLWALRAARFALRPALVPLVSLYRLW